KVFPDLLRPLSTAASLEAGLQRTLRRIVRTTHAVGGLLVFRPPRREPITVTVTGGLSRPLRDWLGAVALGPSSRRPDVRGARVVRLPLGTPPHIVGELVLIAGRRRAPKLPPDFPRELGAALELLDESRRRADELSALYATSRLITARLDLA